MGLFVYIHMFTWMVLSCSSVSGGYVLTAKCTVNKRGGPDYCVFTCDTNSTLTSGMAWTLYKRYSSVIYNVERSTCNYVEVFPVDYSSTCSKEIFTLNLTKTVGRRDTGMWNCHAKTGDKHSNNISLVVVGGDARIVVDSSSQAGHTSLHAYLTLVVVLAACVLNSYIH